MSSMFALSCALVKNGPLTVVCVSHDKSILDKMAHQEFENFKKENKISQDQNLISARNPKKLDEVSDSSSYHYLDGDFKLYAEISPVPVV